MSHKSSANSQRIASAVERKGGQFVLDESDENSVARAQESAAVVREAIQNFPTNDEELAGTKVEAFNDAQTFLDVWTMEKNAKHRPVFLKAVASPDVLDLLFSYVRPSSDGIARPSYLVTNSLGVLNRLFRDPIVAGTVAKERLPQILKDFSSAAAASTVEQINTKLMLLEISSVLLPCAEATTVESGLVESGWLDVALGCLSPSNASLDTAEEAIMYRNIAAMLGCRLLTGVMCAHGASVEFVAKHAPSLFALSLQGFSWLSSEGPIHAVIQSVNNQLDRMPSLVSSKEVKAFLEAPATSSVDWTKFPEYAVLRTRIQGRGSCVVCGALDGKLQICGQCKRRGVLYCGRKCQSKDWPRHKFVCQRKVEDSKK